MHKIDQRWIDSALESQWLACVR